jgi:hypothetical protein
MTTGFDVLDASISDASRIFRQGAGFIKPNRAVDPGLVFDSNANDWLALLCGSTTGVNPATCAALATAGYSFDASDMNTASIAIGDMPGTQTVTRRVTNVGNTAATYTASFTGMAGITTVINPSSLNIPAGQTKTFTVSFTRTSAPFNAYQGGQLTWTDGAHNVRVPMVVRPVQFAAPANVFGNGTPISYNVKFGYTGPWGTTLQGLVPAATNAGSVATNASQSFNVVVPAGTTRARFSLFDEPANGSNDLDLEVRNSANVLVGSSGGPTAAEQVNLVNPPADTYTVTVIGFATQNPTANFTLYNWVIGSTSAGNMAISAPGSATLGTTGVVNLTFSGLAPATKYLGTVSYTGVTTPATVVNVDTP